MGKGENWSALKLTLYKYILSEIWPNFLASLFISVFIVLASKLLPITELIISRGVRAVQVIRMVIYLLPDIITFALPAVTLIAVVVAFLRLSSDSEIIALKSSGVSIYQMLPPVVVFAFLGFLIAIIVSIAAVPWGNKSFKNLVFKIAESKADLGIRERIFCEPFDNVIFYINSFSSREKVMKGVFVADRRDNDITNTIIAEEAMIFPQPKQRIITLHFLKGTIFVAENNLETGRTIRFNTYDLNIGLKDIMAALASREKAPKELSVGELIEELGKTQKGDVRYNEMMIDLLEKFAIPLAVFLMGIIGVPLGAQIKSKGRSAGVRVSLGVFFVYYMCLAGARSICETAAISPAIGVWIPDLFLLISCIYLFRRVANERSVKLLPRFFVRSQGL